MNIDMHGGGPYMIIRAGSRGECVDRAPRAFGVYKHDCDSFLVLIVVVFVFLTLPGSINLQNVHPGRQPSPLLSFLSGPYHIALQTNILY
jgi:hypothetical protein